MIFLWKKKYLAILLFVVIAVQITAIFVASVNSISQETSFVSCTVVIDAGHGGKDAGVTATDGTKESDLNLAYAKTLGQMFENCGFNVVFTRKTQGGLYGLPTKGFKMRDMEARKKIIQQSNANILLSIHMNQYQPQVSRKGPQVFFQEQSEQGLILAQNLQKALNNFTGNNHQQIGGDYYVCKVATCPAVIVECGFLSNAQELSNLKMENYRQDLCQAIFNGVMMFLCS